MKKTREELEAAINDSPLFSTDRTNDGELFAKEEERLLANLAKLMSARGDFDKIGFEIIDTATKCIDSYKPGEGPFLNYFNNSLKRNLAREKGKQKIDEVRKGVKLSKEMDRRIRNIFRYAKMEAVNDVYTEEFAAMASGALALTVEEVFEALATNKYATVYSGDDDGKLKLFDIIEDERGVVGEKTEKAEDALYKIRQVIEPIDATFKKEQNRTKPVLSDLLTAYLLTDLKSGRVLDDAAFVEKVFSGISFVNREMYARYVKSGDIPATKACEIAKTHGRFESSVSRTYSNFEDKWQQKKE